MSDPVHEFCLSPDNVNQWAEISDAKFQWQDFVVFGSVLAVSAIIGKVFKNFVNFFLILIMNLWTQLI